jgi:hypothetical protein
MDLSTDVAARAYLSLLTAAAVEHVDGRVDIRCRGPFMVDIEWWDGPSSRIEVQPTNGIFGSVWDWSGGTCRGLPEQPLIALGVLLERAKLG